MKNYYFIVKCNKYVQFCFVFLLMEQSTLTLISVVCRSLVCVCVCVRLDDVVFHLVGSGESLCSYPFCTCFSDDRCMFPNLVNPPVCESSVGTGW